MISFDEASHTYRVGGLDKPSVTQVLDFMGRVSPFCKSSKAASFGKEIHSLLERFDKGCPAESDLPEDHMICLALYKQYKRDINPAFADIEAILYDEELQVCGTVDRAGNNPDFIMDIKTGSSIPESARLQTAAYARMRFPLTYELARRYCVQINPKLKTYKIKTYEDPKDFIEWENICRQYWNEMEKMS